MCVGVWIKVDRRIAEMAGLVKLSFDKNPKIALTWAPEGKHRRR